MEYAASKLRSKGQVMIQAIGYIRRSTDLQEESLDQQRARLEAFAESRGWSLVTIYSDDAISGSEMNRPGLRELVRDVARRDEVDVVVTWDRNRLARPKDPVDGLLLERELLGSGKRVVYAASGQEADRSFASGLMSYVEHHQSGDYLRKLSRDTARGHISRVERGYWPGGPIPFGYDRLIVDAQGRAKRIVRDVGDGTQVVIEPDTAEVVEEIPAGVRHKKQDHEFCALIPSEPSRVRAVQRIFADYSTGKPVRSIRDWLNACGHRTSRGSKFTAATIHPLLENPAYTGRNVYNRRTLSKWHRVEEGQSVERMDEGVERRPESDWIVYPDAWPALVDDETFEQVQQRRQASREEHQHVTGRAVGAGYLLTGLVYCGVCGGRLQGVTQTSGKGYRTRYYICSVHHKGDHERCPTRYTVPADVVEQHIITLIKLDLVKLRDDDKLHQYVADEVRRVRGGDDDAREQLQRRLAELDQNLANVREHLTALDTDTAQDLGLYDQAKLIADQRHGVEGELERLGSSGPDLPDTNELRRRAAAAFDDLDAVIDGGTIEEKRELIKAYVKRIEADPTVHTVQISLYPALFTWIIAGVGFEPTTSGL